MYSEELKMERQKRLERQLGRCAKCKFSNYNYGIGHVASNYCHIREERMDREYGSDFLKIMFCRSFKNI